MGNYREAYEWSLRIYSQQFERYERQEKKASRYLTAAGALLGILGFSGGSIANRIFPLSGILSWGTLSLVAAFFTLIFLAWLCKCCFSVLQTQDLKVLPASEELINVFHDNEEEVMFDRLSQDVARAARKNRSITRGMGESLAHAHKALIGVAIAVSFFGVALAATEATARPSHDKTRIEVQILMSNEESTESGSSDNGGSSSGNGSSSSGNEGRPGDQVEPFEFPTIQENEDPDHNTKIDSDNRKGGSKNTSSEGNGED
jgi:hypothetical protein